MITLGMRIREAYKMTRESWGGCTLRWGALSWVPQGIDAYAVTVKTEGVDSIEIPEDADFDTFHDAFMKACAEFHTDWLGVFHDDVKHTIDFDPVIVAATTAEVDKIAATHEVVGGAYHFLDGEGYWPQGRPAAYSA